MSPSNWSKNSSLTSKWSRLWSCSVICNFYFKQVWLVSGNLFFLKAVKLNAIEPSAKKPATLYQNRLIITDLWENRGLQNYSFPDLLTMLLRRELYKSLHICYKAVWLKLLILWLLHLPRQQNNLGTGFLDLPCIIANYCKWTSFKCSQLLAELLFLVIIKNKNTSNLQKIEVMYDKILPTFFFFGNKSNTFVLLFLQFLRGVVIFYQFMYYTVLLHSI